LGDVGVKYLWWNPLKHFQTTSEILIMKSLGEKMTRKTFKEALLDAWDALIPLVGINVIWFLLTILVIPAIPAFGGLYCATNQIAHGKTADIRTFFEGFKDKFWISWKWGLLNLVVYGLLMINIWFYGQFEGFGYVILQSLFFSMMLIFTCMQIYTYPFLLEQEEPSLKNAIRNSFAAFLRFMGRSFGLLILFIILVAVSILLPPLWIILTMSIILYLANWQTLVVIHELKKVDSEVEDEPGFRIKPGSDI
jgi:uncharacterized membrane protein YesL